MKTYGDSHVDEEVIKALVAPWFPGATVDTVDISTSCGCYSEWTTESCHFRLTLNAPRPADETRETLSKIVSAVEPIVLAWANATYEWSGCSSCCCDDPDCEHEGLTSVDLRVIPHGL